MAIIQAQWKDESGRIICSSSAKGLIFWTYKAVLQIKKQKANTIAKRTKERKSQFMEKEREVTPNACSNERHLHPSGWPKPRKKLVNALWRGCFLSPDCGAWICGTGQRGSVARTLCPAHCHTMLVRKGGCGKPGRSWRAGARAGHWWHHSRCPKGKELWFGQGAGEREQAA